MSHAGSVEDEVCSLSSNDVLSLDHPSMIIDDDVSQGAQNPVASTRQQQLQQQQLNKRYRGSSGKSESLPSGWILVASKSKPGAFYYAHPATRRTQSQRPITLDSLYSGLPMQPDVLNGETKVSTGVSPASEMQTVANEGCEDKETRLKEAAKMLRKQAQEEHTRKRKEAEDALRQAQAASVVEEAAMEEVLRKAREKRVSKQEGDEHKDDQRSAVLVSRSEIHNNLRDKGRLSFDSKKKYLPLDNDRPRSQTSSGSRSRSQPKKIAPLKRSKSQKKEDKRRKAAEKEKAKEAKKTRKLQKQIDKTKRQLKEANRVLGSRPGKRAGCSSSSSSASSGSS